MKRLCLSLTLLVMVSCSSGIYTNSKVHSDSKGRTSYSQGSRKMKNGYASRKVKKNARAYRKKMNRNIMQSGIPSSRY